jgi:hypothetical protein
LGLAAVFVLAGCGAMSQRAGSRAPIVADASAPPIEPVDEAPSADPLGFFEIDWTAVDSASSDSSGSQGISCYGRLTVGDPQTAPAVAPPAADDTSCRPPTAEEQAQWRAEM